MERFVGCSVIDDTVGNLCTDDRRRSASDNRQFANLCVRALTSLSWDWAQEASALESRRVPADRRDCIATNGAVPVEYAARKAAVAQLVEQLIRNQ